MKLQTKPRGGKINPRQILETKRGYCDKVHDDLTEQGVTFFSPEVNGGLDIDTEYLSLPRNITDVSSKDLGEYLNAFTQQKVYIRTLVGYAEMLAEEARREYVSASEEAYRDLLGSKLSETSKDREVNSREDVRPLYEAWIEAKNKVKLLSYNIENLVDIIFMLSREVSRRTGDFNDERRDYNING